MRTFVVAAILAVGGCSTGQRDLASTPVPKDCAGERVVRVDNRVAADADVFAWVNRARVYLGTVKANHSAEWTLPAGASRASAEVNKTPANRRNQTVGPIRFFYSCSAT